MTDRILPEPDRYAICPQSGSILSFYGGTFEAAYILLNPFIRPVSISAERYMEWADMTANDVHRSCEAVSWAKVQQLSEVASLQEIDWALKTSIGAVSKKYAREDLSTKLIAALQSNRLYPPVEGRIPELSQNTMLSFIQSLGHQWVWLGDELCTERKLHWIDDLKPPAATAEFGLSSVFTPDKSLLWTVHWDSHFSLFCSTRENVDRLSRWPGLEGFPCTQDTEVFWSSDCLKSK
jgi:hypothetical protein